MISIVIPCSNRPIFEDCLRANREVFAAERCELIVTHAGADLASLKRILTSGGMRRALLVDVEGAPFNKSLCLNIGAVNATGEMLFLLDCDVVISEKLMTTMLNELTLARFVQVDKVIETDPAAQIQTMYNKAAGIDNRECRWLHECRTVTNLVFSNGKSATYDLWQGIAGRSASGLILVHRQNYLAIEGCNSDTDGWGFEDWDLQIRLQVSLDLERRSVGFATHMTHPAPEDRFAQCEGNLHRCFNKYRAGNFLGTCSRDVVGWESRVRKYIIRGECIEDVGERRTFEQSYFKQ